MAYSEISINNFVLNCEINDFNSRFETETAEIGGWLCNSRWKMNFYPKGPDDTDTCVWCDLVRLPGGPKADLKLQIKFQFFHSNDILIYQTEYLTHTFEQTYGRKYHKTTMNTNALLTGIRNNGSKPLIFRCIIKDRNSSDFNRQIWFNL